MPLTKFFRIAVEGATVDGRTIDRAWIDEMAAGYNPETYTARINCEHIAGFSPEPPFNSYGSVAAVRAVDFNLMIDGKPQKRRALEAQFDVNDQLVALNKKGQKLFTSCEIAPNFAGTGKAGLVGLAITDNPASLGTEMLAFAARATVNPLAARKQDQANHFSEAVECAFDLAGKPAEPSETTTALGAIAAFFSGLVKKEEPEPAKESTPPEPANDNAAIQFAKQTAALVGIVDKLAKSVDGLDARFTKIESAQASFAATIENTDANAQKRRLSTGGGGGTVVATDC